MFDVSVEIYRPTDVVNLWGDMSKVAADNAASDIRKMNLAEYLEKGIVK